MEAAEVKAMGGTVTAASDDERRRLTLTSPVCASNFAPPFSPPPSLGVSVLQSYRPMVKFIWQLSVHTVCPWPQLLVPHGQAASPATGGLESQKGGYGPAAPKAGAGLFWYP